MKKVLFVTNLPAPYKVSFFELLSQSVDLTVVYERRSASNRDDRWRNEETRSFKEVYLNGITVGEESSFAPAIIGCIKKGNYDSIIMNGYSSPTAMLAIEYMRNHRIPFGIMCDGMLPSEDSKLKGHLKRRLVGAASFWLSSGDITTKQLLKYGAKKEQIYKYPFSSVKESEIVSAPFDKHIYKKIIGCNSSAMILYIGQFIHRKGIDVLLKAHAPLSDSVELRIVGGDHYPQEQEHENVVFEGFKTKEELKNYYAAADLFVLPTREDIWGLVVNEAFAFGLPVITSDNCGAGLEMISEGVNGYLFPNEDAAALNEKIVKALRLNCFDASTKIASNYSLEKMAENTLCAIESIFV